MGEVHHFRPRIAVLSRFSGTASALRYEAVVSSRRLLESIWRAGGEPLQLLAASGHGADDWDTRLDHFDAVLLPGGGDLNPATYGEEIGHESVYDVNDLQDAQDLSIAKYVIASGMPFLAICRGMHVVNIAAGGSLHQHIEPMHRNHLHEVRFDRDWAAFGLSGPQVQVSCYHHQAINEVGKGWEVVARSIDGWIEAMVHETANGVAVQWHPEDTSDSDPAQAAIFSDFVRRASQR